MFDSTWERHLHDEGDVADVVCVVFACVFVLTCMKDSFISFFYSWTFIERTAMYKTQINNHIQMKSAIIILICMHT